MKDFIVKCDLVIEASTEEEAYEKFLDYLAECVRYGDVTVFDFKERNENEDGARPDLLAALLIAEAALAAYSGGESSDLDAIRAAIAKATGGAA